MQTYIQHMQIHKTILYTLGIQQILAGYQLIYLTEEKIPIYFVTNVACSAVCSVFT